jgi:peptidyl-prolyl cis-trans isomerase C
MKPAVATLALMTALAAGSCCLALAQGAPDDVLAENATVKLTRADYEADLERIPADMRAAFATDSKRVSALLNNLLVGKTLAAQARNAGIDRDPVVQRRLALEAERVLADIQLRHIEAAAGAEFDAKAAQFVAKARERYLLEKEKFTTPEQVSASHILFSTKDRSPEAALALAKATQAKLSAGADFAALAQELSDDPGSKTGGGHLNWFFAKQMDPAFATAAFDLKNVGDMSPPVLSRFGYHLIRLDGRRPARVQTFDEVKDQLMADLRQSYVNGQRDLKVAAIRNDPALKLNQPALNALIVPMPESTELRRLLQESQKK